MHHSLGPLYFVAACTYSRDQKLPGHESAKFQENYRPQTKPATVFCDLMIIHFMMNNCRHWLRGCYAVEKSAEVAMLVVRDLLHMAVYKRVFRACV